MITKGSDVLDAVVEGVTIVELDPEGGGRWLWRRTERRRHRATRFVLHARSQEASGWSRGAGRCQDGCVRGEGGFGAY